MAKSEVKLLRAQFDSHFLFNNLNAINWYIQQQDPGAASSYLKLFARLLRCLMADSQREFVRLSDELETMRLYVKVESLRFNRQIQFVSFIGTGIDPGQVWIPSLILHTYLERAIWNTLHGQDEEGVIQLEVAKASDRYHLVLTDNGTNTGTDRSQGLKSQKHRALELVEERLRLLNQQFGTDMQIRIGNPGLRYGPGDPGRKDSVRSNPRSSVDLSFHPFVI